MVNKEIREDLQANEGKVDDRIIDKLRTYLANRWRIKITNWNIIKYTFKKVLSFAFLRNSGAPKEQKLGEAQTIYNLHKRGQ